MEISEKKTKKRRLKMKQFSENYNNINYIMRLLESTVNIKYSQTKESLSTLYPTDIIYSAFRKNFKKGLFQSQVLLNQKIRSSPTFA